MKTNRLLINLNLNCLLSLMQFVIPITIKYNIYILSKNYKFVFHKLMNLKTCNLLNNILNK